MFIKKAAHTRYATLQRNVKKLAICAENWTRTNNTENPIPEVTLKYTTIREHLSEYKTVLYQLSYLRILPFKDRAYPLFTPL